MEPSVFSLVSFSRPAYKWVHWLLLISATVSPAAANASSSINVKATSLITNQQGVVIFVVEGTKSAAPACDTAKRWAIAANTPNGQVLAATLLAAYMSGRTVTVVGNNTCTNWGDSENVEYIVVAPS